MKALKMLPLAIAMAAASTASYGMEELDESLMADFTGQAGVTIEQDLDLTIGSVVYTDDDGVGASAGGDLTVETIVIATGLESGGTRGAANITTTIDVDGDDDALVLGNSISALDISVGGIKTGGSESIGSVLIDNLSISGNGTGGSSIVKIKAGGASGGGITIDQSMNLKVDNIAYTDDGTITVTDLELYGTGGTGTTINLEGMKIDVNSADQIEITQPTIQGGLSVGGVNIGGNSIGAIAVNNINMAASTVTIYGH